jgi:hypothetical protein
MEGVRVRELGNVRHDVSFTARPSFVPGFVRQPELTPRLFIRTFRLKPVLKFTLSTSPKSSSGSRTPKS